MMFTYRIQDSHVSNLSDPKEAMDESTLRIVIELREVVQALHRWIDTVTLITKTSYFETQPA